jgi:hypothetical protein
MGTSGEKFTQARRRQRDGVGSSDASDVEARRPRRRDQFRLGYAEI